MDEELKALQGEAAQIDAQLAPTPTPEEGAQIAQPGNQNEAAELSALVQIVSGMFAPMFPSLKRSTPRNLATHWPQRPCR